MISLENKFSRRGLLNHAKKATVAGAVAFQAPYVFAKAKYTVRVMGTHVTLQETLRQQAMKDLGIHVEFEPSGSASVLQKASTSPESFDIYEQWSDSINVLWQAKSIQAIETERIRYWDEINALSKTGQLTEDSKIGQGDAPNKILFVQKMDD